VRLDKWFRALYNTVMTTTTTTFIPVVRDLRTAAKIAHEYDTVVTAGPRDYEVEFGHHNHIVESFGDTTMGDRAPRLEQIERLVELGSAGNGSVLVHCHEGISRSTATAIGIMIARGADPRNAVRDLANAHPTFHPFYPNRLIVSHLENIFGYDRDELEAIISCYRLW